MDLEKTIAELEQKVKELTDLAKREKLDMANEINQLQTRADELKKQLLNSFTRIQTVRLARHPKRPYLQDYVDYLCTDFIELHGDRIFGDDKAIVGGTAFFEDIPVMILGQQKGRNTKDNIYRNFAMPHPEGYRKALRLMKMAEKFKRPLLIFVDTPGAYPGIGAEERGQAWAIAENLREMSTLSIPIIITIIGEGASGGALGIGVGNKVYMLENSWFCVISPEGCSAILWRDAKMAPQAAEALKLTADDLMQLEVIDSIIPEPNGGAHIDFEATAEEFKKVLKASLKELLALSPEEIIEHRLQRYRKIGVFNII